MSAPNKKQHKNKSLRRRKRHRNLGRKRWGKNADEIYEESGSEHRTKTVSNNSFFYKLTVNQHCGFTYDLFYSIVRELTTTVY